MGTADVCTWGKEVSHLPHTMSNYALVILTFMRPARPHVLYMASAPLALHDDIFKEKLEAEILNLVNTNESLSDSIDTIWEALMGYKRDICIAKQHKVRRALQTRLETLKLNSKHLKTNYQVGMMYRD
ncbi:hypothetical protein NDU88_001672 [Pleurodeles waltl]|uniref:Uncharacterized protein n=1 Tax=Pleurodeles waltl TaxID=8319 RepID=A0AAV7WQ22_PLEWA|nr:hypothetical protein NDU88_001672 [Pleurodeles waltl]